MNTIELTEANMTEATTPMTEATTPSATLHGATISKQLNGSSLYVVFEGTEQAITDAFNNLYNIGALNAELEWIADNQAVVVSTVEQFKRGLASRELMRILDQPEVIAANKGKHGRPLRELSQVRAEAFWNRMAPVRVITPMTYAAPYFYRMGDNSASDSDMSGRD